MGVRVKGELGRRMVIVYIPPSSAWITKMKLRDNNQCGHSCLDYPKIQGLALNVNIGHETFRRAERLIYQHSMKDRRQI
ncbi:hypothetical protein BDR06DRAFT_962674, partial [Suillus hirtellus]